MSNKDNILIRYVTPEGSFVEGFKNEREVERFIKGIASKIGKENVAISVIEKIDNFSHAINCSSKIIKLGNSNYLINYNIDTIEVCRLIDDINDEFEAASAGKEWITTRSTTRKTTSNEIRDFLDESFISLDDLLTRFDKRFVVYINRNFSY